MQKLSLFLKLIPIQLSHKNFQFQSAQVQPGQSICQQLQRLEKSILSSTTQEAQAPITSLCKVMAIILMALQVRRSIVTMAHCWSCLMEPNGMQSNLSIKYLGICNLWITQKLRYTHVYPNNIYRI